MLFLSSKLVYTQRRIIFVDICFRDRSLPNKFGAETLCREVHEEISGCGKLTDYIRDMEKMDDREPR